MGEDDITTRDLLKCLHKIRVELESMLIDAQVNSELDDKTGEWRNLASNLEDLSALSNRLYEMMRDPAGHVDTRTFDRAAFDHPDRRFLVETIHALLGDHHTAPETMRVQLDIPKADILMTAALASVRRDPASGALVWSDVLVQFAADGEWDILRRQARPQLSFLLRLVLDRELHQLSTGSHVLFWPEQRKGPPDPPDDPSPPDDDIPF